MNKRGKYKAKRTPKSFDGIGWDSGEEKNYYYAVLIPRRDAGEIDDLQCHKSVLLVDCIKWKVDYTYYDVARRCQVWEEYKGVETADYRIKRDLWRKYGPGELRIIKGKFPRYLVTDTIIPEGKDGA